MSPQIINAEVVEGHAQKLFLYDKTMQTHLAELRKNSDDILATYDLVSQAPSSTQAAVRWPPEPHQRDSYMKHMDEICRSFPSSEKEHMEIVFASYSACTCYMLFYINPLHPAVRTKVLARYRDLSRSYVRKTASLQQQNKKDRKCYNPASLLPASQSHAFQSIGRMPVNGAPSHAPQYSSPQDLAPRPLTPGEKSAFSTNLTAAIGRHFVLDPNSSEPLPYKVVELRVSEGSMIYEVLLAGSLHTEKLEREEVLSMIDASWILE